MSSRMQQWECKKNIYYKSKNTSQPNGNDATWFVCVLWVERVECSHMYVTHLKEISVDYNDTRGI